MRTRRLVAGLSLLIVPVTGFAQQTPPDSAPRARSWGAEVFLGSGGPGASVLRFQSSRFALLFGADFSITQADEEIGDDQTSSTTQSNFGARLGARWYLHSSTERLRPVVGLGARGSYSRLSSEVRPWTAGVYGELGAMYFLTPHVSLGGTGELQVSYGKRQRLSVIGQSFDTKTMTVSGSLMRVMLSVYF